jgi:heme exporter protein D
MNGFVSGGWGFVWAAYGVTAFILVTYALRIFAGLRSAHRQR